MCGNIKTSSVFYVDAGHFVVNQHLCIQPFSAFMLQTGLKSWRRNFCCCYSGQNCFYYIHTAFAYIFCLFQCYCCFCFSHVLYRHTNTHRTYCRSSKQSSRHREKSVYAPQTLSHSLEIQRYRNECRFYFTNAVDVMCGFCGRLSWLVW